MVEAHQEGGTLEKEGETLGRNASGKEMEPRGSKGALQGRTGHPPGSVQRGSGHHPQPVSTPFREPRELGYRGFRRGPRRVVQGAGQVGLAARAVRRHLPALADPNASSERRPGSALSARAALNPLLAAAAALSAREPSRPLPPPRAAPDALTLCALETPAPRPPARLQLLLPRDREPASQPAAWPFAGLGETDTPKYKRK